MTQIRNDSSYLANFKSLAEDKITITPTMQLILCNIDSNNRIILDNSATTAKPIRRTIDRMVKSNLAKNISRDLYFINPRYFVKSSTKQFSKLEPEYLKSE